MGLIRPTEGDVRIFGELIVPGAPVLARVGAFIEGPGLLPHLSGRDNLRLFWAATGRPEADADFETALEIAGLGASVERRVKTYSHGMKQRLAIAQAMLGLPELLVLDEPTNGLDPPQIAEMREVLQRYAATGRTVVVSSHLLAEVEQTCTHVVVMHKGRLVAAGSVERDRRHRWHAARRRGRRARGRGAGGGGHRVRGGPGPARAGRRVPRDGRRRQRMTGSIPERSAATRRGVHDRLMQLPPVHDTGFRPGRTLRLRVEFVRQLRRRRTQLAGLVLLVLPILIALAFELGSPSNSRNASALVDLATSGRHQLRAVRRVRVGRLPAGRDRRAVLRRHRGQRGQLVVAALPAGDPGAARPAVAPEADRGADPELRREPAAACVVLPRRRCVLRLGAGPLAAGRHVHERGGARTARWS